MHRVPRPYGSGGLSQRSEWEARTKPGVFDFSIITDVDLRKFLEAHHACLQPVFSTDFTRTAWTLNYSDAVIEMALDRGLINSLALNCSAAPASEPICELELELIEGQSPDALFALATELASKLQLHPEPTSKAERGYALAMGVVAQPFKAFSPSINGAMAPLDAFRSIALSCLLQLQRNEAGAIDGTNPEYIHQARIAIRRLRSALNLFSPVLCENFVAVYAPLWQKLASRLGEVRDWNVFLAETLVPVEEAFPDDTNLAALRARGEASKTKAQASAAIALTQKEYSQLLLNFSAALFRAMPPTIAAEESTGDCSEE